MNKKKDKKVKTISICIPEDIIKDIDEICMNNYISRSHYITGLIVRDLEYMEGVSNEKI